MAKVSHPRLSRSSTKTLDFRLYWLSDDLAQIMGVAAGLAVPLVVFRHTQDRGATGIVSTAALACAALVHDSLAVVVPLGIAVLFAPAAGAVIYAKLVGLIDEHAFGRVTTIQSTTVTTLSGVWNTPLGYITSAWSFLAGFWACAGLAVLGFATTFLFNSAVARSETR